MRRRLVPIAIGIVILLLMTWIQASNNQTVRRLRNRFEELFYAEFLAQVNLDVTEKAPHIVIVDIDEKSITQIGRWPWPRSDMINLLKSIRTQGAAVVAFDIVFGDADENPVDILEKLARNSQQEPRNIEVLNSLRPLVVGDSAFAAALNEKNIDTVLGFKLHQDLSNPSRGKMPLPEETADSDAVLVHYPRYFANIPILQDAVGSAGYMNAAADEDGSIRRAPLIARVGNEVYASLAVQAAKAYLQEDQLKVIWKEKDRHAEVDAIQIGQIQIPTDASGQIIIPYDYDHNRYTYIAASDLLSGQFPKDIFEGALVIVGSSSFRFGDLHATPVSGVFPGVEIQAIIAESVISGRVLYTPSWARDAEVIFTALLGLMLALLLPFMGTLGIAIVVFLTLLCLVAIYAYFFLAQGMVFAVTASIWQVSVSGIFNLAYGLFIEGRRRKKLKDLFGQYVPPQHVEHMSEHPEKYSGQGESANLTVLFADIIGFTTMVQQLSAEETRALLNQFFTPMTKIIFKTQGTIDKYVGDMLMAFWGAPIADPHHAKHALEAALGMRSEVEVLKRDFLSRGLPKIEIGIGINTGDMFVGDMGSEFRRTYTVLGDAVNVGARVEALCRYYGVNIIVGEATRSNQDEFVFRLLDRVRVKGRSIPLQIYELVGRKGELAEAQAKEIEEHERALHYYFAREFDKARMAFEALETQYPEAKLYKLFGLRMREMMHVDLPKEWDGAYQWLSK